MKRSGSTSNPSHNHNDNRGMSQTMDQANLMAMDQLADSTSLLLDHTKRLHFNLKDQNNRISTMLQNSMAADDGMSQGRQFVKTIVDDPTAVGVCKIAILVFTVLCVLYFGGKLTFKILKLIFK